MTWSVLEDLSNEIDSDDCVIVGDDDMWTLYLTLRATTGAAMYPEMERQCSAINAFVYPKLCKSYDDSDRLCQTT